MDDVVFEGGVEDDLVPGSGLNAGEEFGGAFPVFLVVDEDNAVAVEELVDCGGDQLIANSVVSFRGDVRGSGFVEDVGGARFEVHFSIMGLIDDELVALPFVIVSTKIDSITIGARFFGKATCRGVERTEIEMESALDVEDCLCFTDICEIDKTCAGRGQGQGIVRIVLAERRGDRLLRVGPSLGYVGFKIFKDLCSVMIEFGHCSEWRLKISKLGNFSQLMTVDRKGRKIQENEDYLLCVYI